MKKILVTGGSGYVGSHVAKMLYENGYEPIVFDLQARSRTWAHLHWEAIAGDITNKWSLENVFNKHNFDAVIHLAAVTTIPRSIVDPMPYYRTNVGGTAALVEACIQHRVNKIVFSSSSTIYGPSSNLPRVEDARKEPLTAYGASKLAAEHIFRDAGVAHGIKSVGLRYFNASGASPDGLIGEYRDIITHLIPSIQTVVEGHRSQFCIYGTDFDTPDKTAVKDFTHVWDIAAAHINALEYLNNGGNTDIFNIGGGDPKSILEMFTEYQLQLKEAIPVCIKPARAGDVACNYADITKAKRILGWEPKMSDRGSIVRDALNWYATDLYKSL